MPEVVRTRIGSYAVAALFSLAGLAVTALAAGPLAGPFFMFQFAAVACTVLYGGLGPGLLATALSGAGSYALFCAPGLEPYEAYRLLSFAVVSVFFAWLANGMRRATTAAEEARAAAEATRARAEAAEAEARAIGAQQERLVAIVSHDLRSPLNAITITAEHLQRQGGSEKQARALARIVASARRMNAMVHDLLDYARARHASGLPVRPRPVRVGDVCRAALDEVRSAHAGGAVSLQVTGDDAAVVDPARVEQLVANLVTNALQHGSPGAPVSVAVAEAPGGVCIEVANGGPSIPPDLVPALFDPFRPGDGAGSVGLGLFIVREIARAHGGEVSVRSGGGGTAFTVLLPRAALPANDAAA